MCKTHCMSNMSIFFDNKHTDQCDLNCTHHHPERCAEEYLTLCYNLDRVKLGILLVL